MLKTNAQLSRLQMAAVFFNLRWWYLHCPWSWLPWVRFMKLPYIIPLPDSELLDNNAKWPCRWQSITSQSLIIRFKLNWEKTHPMPVSHRVHTNEQERHEKTTVSKRNGQLNQLQMAATLLSLRRWRLLSLWSKLPWERFVKLPCIFPPLKSRSSDNVAKRHCRSQVSQSQWVASLNCEKTRSLRLGHGMLNFERERDEEVAILTQNAQLSELSWPSQ